MSRSRKSLENILARSQLVLDNTKDAAVAPLLAEYGYADERLAELKRLYDAANALYDWQKSSYGSQYGATDALDAKRDDADDLYASYLKVARTAFRKNRDVATKLGLSGRRDHDFDGRWAEAKLFFDNALADAAVIAGFAKFNITKEKLSSGKRLIDEVIQQNSAQESAKGSARGSTQERNAAFGALADWMSDFIGIAKVALRKKPELLVKLGIGAATSADRPADVLPVTEPKAAEPAK
ncbi:MAG: hypothetical protein HZC28_14775 [Spirochaetes bacterium]|nr:hypothetical protein [Spirochaetota bacterium]